MNLNCNDIDELIRQFLILKCQYDELSHEKNKLEIVIDCKDEEIKTLKEILGIKKEDK